VTDTVGTVYGDTMYKDEGMLATWFPDRHLRVGDVISRSETTGALTVECTLIDLVGDKGYTTVQRSGAESVVLQRGVTIDAVAGGTAETVGATAELQLSFDKSSSFAFSGRNASIDEYERVGPIREDLLSLYTATKWDAGWQLVTSVRGFKRATILIARQSGTTARISLEAGTKLAGLEAASASAGIAITRGDAVKWVMKDSTPLYEAMQVRPGGPFRGTTVVDGRYLEDPAPSEDSRVVRATPHELSL
jgi:hypothetical protein